MLASLSKPAFAVALGGLLLSTSVLAQSPELPQPSPKASASQRVGVTDFSIEYSSPGVKGRKVFGEVVPFDKVWRTGANATTTFKASQEFMLGDKKVPAGSYALLTIPGKSSWTILLNSNLQQNGAGGYDDKTEVARISVKPATSGMRERLTFIFADATDDSVKLDLEWEKVRVSIPLKVDTNALVLAGIDKSLAEAWRPHFASARWLLEAGGSLDDALRYADTSISIKPTWWNNWVRAQILAKQNKSADAVAAAQKAQELGKGDYVYDGFFKDNIQKSIDGWKKNKS